MRILASIKSLTKFEIALWAVSVIVVTLSFVLSPAKDYLTLVSSLIGVSALIFVAKGHVLGQLLTVVFAVFYIIISYYFHYYGEMIICLTMTGPIALMSVISWIRHPYEKTAEVKVNRMNGKQIIFMLGLAAAITCAFYFILRALNTANLIISTISVTTSFLAAYLTLNRSSFYALAFAANDVILITMWVLATIENVSYLPMIICFVMFLINDLYGFYNWQRMKKRQSTSVAVTDNEE